jgi:death on curing protein
MIGKDQGASLKPSPSRVWLTTKSFARRRWPDSPRPLPASRNEPRWLPFDEIVAINREVVAATDEPHSLSSPELLDGAINRPRNYYEYEGVADVMKLAVILLFAICRKSSLSAGKQAYRFCCSNRVLFINGYELNISDSDHLADWIVDVICGRMSEDEFIAIVAPYVAEIEL